MHEDRPPCDDYSEEAVHRRLGQSGAIGSRFQEVHRSAMLDSGQVYSILKGTTMSFLKKPIGAALLLAGAAGGPYVLYETDAGQSARNSAGQAMGGPMTGSPVMGTPTNSTTGVGSSWWPFGGSTSASQGASNIQPTLTVTPINSLLEVLRFDVPPGWVMQHFPTVNTGIGESQLDGFRVPLITGTRPDDLVGALTYYFDRFQRVQRISLHAVTGDPTRISRDVQQHFRLAQQPALGGGLYTTRWNGSATNVMHITPAAVITANDQNARFQVFLELNQPGLEYGLSAQAKALLDAGAAQGRW